MYELNKNGKVFTSKFVGNGPSSYEKRIYRVAVSQRLRNTVLVTHSYVTSMKMAIMVMSKKTAVLILKKAPCPSLSTS